MMYNGMRLSCKVRLIQGDYFYFSITAELSLMSLSKIFKFEFEIFVCQCFSLLRILIILCTMRFDSDSLGLRCQVYRSWRIRKREKLFLICLANKDKYSRGVDTSLPLCVMHALYVAQINLETKLIFCAISSFSLILILLSTGSKR